MLEPSQAARSALNNENLTDKFYSGEVVFKITRIPNIDGHSEEDYGIVQTVESYMQRKNTHVYTPLLYMCDFPTQLAYLYGCLNRKFGKPQKYSYIFWWRQVSTKEWHKWFIAHPYIEKLDA